MLTSKVSVYLSQCVCVCVMEKEDGDLRKKAQQRWLNSYSKCYRRKVLTADCNCFHRIFFHGNPRSDGVPFSKITSNDLQVVLFPVLQNLGEIRCEQNLYKQHKHEKPLHHEIERERERERDKTTGNVTYGIGFLRDHSSKFGQVSVGQSTIHHPVFLLHLLAKLRCIPSWKSSFYRHHVLHVLYPFF